MFPERVCHKCEDWNSSEVIGKLHWQGQKIQCCFPYSALVRYLSVLYDLEFQAQIPKTLCFKEKKIRLQWTYISHNLFQPLAFAVCKLRLLGLAADQHPFLQAAQHTHGWALPSKGLSDIPMSRFDYNKLQRNWQNMSASVIENPRLVTTQKW